ncbi:hypothetical protein N7449_007407 [Penicillium cf. viridicatum]|uniref:Uncharacterized protein n=1 Tax=Penicillium cf. viridicatum TaxID=2972119 RepID=A0A9W9MCJ1_9EURO|nr:hypothetical protein N7449_007407 [Penicillium cf. viridicatum]
MEDVQTRGLGREINRRIEYRTLQFTYIYRSDYNNSKVATLRLKTDQKKTKQNKPTLFSTQPQPGQDGPPRSHSSGLDSVLVSSLTFFFFCAV